MKKLLGIVVLGLLLSGCATPTPKPKWTPVTEEDFLKESIFDCLWMPYGPNMTVIINLKLDREGYVLRKEIVDKELIKKRHYARFIDSIFKAIDMCQPLKIPTTNYEEKWKNLRLSISNF